jgi:TIR domain-containing protein
MSDVYISYSRQESPRAQQLARALERAGFSVWWDRQISAGATWASSIERALDEARCVVVLWSANSVKSDWVIDEAAYAREEGKLIQVVVDNVEPPLAFRRYHTLPLTDLTGEVKDTELERLIDAISGKIGK